MSFYNRFLAWFREDPYKLAETQEQFYCNCFFWALRQWRFNRKNGYIATRKCIDYPYCFHWLWSPTGETWYNFTHDHDPFPWWNMLWFKGYVHTGDQQYLEELVNG